MIVASVTPSASSTSFSPPSTTRERQVGDNLINHAFAREWHGASLQHVGFTGLVGVVHNSDNSLDAGNQIHCAAHALDQFARDYPIGEVASLGHFHSSKDRHGDLAVTDHREAFAPSEEGRMRQCRHRLLAGIDQVRVDLTFRRERANSEQAVLLLNVTWMSSGM